MQYLYVSCIINKFNNSLCNKYIELHANHIALQNIFY